MKIFAAALAAMSVAPVMGAGSFSYKPESDKAPGAWASLTEIEGNQCGGSGQSGIDVPTHACDVRGDYKFAAGSCTLDDLIFSINDHSILATYDPDSLCAKPQMTIPGGEGVYEALQFHLHTGSDHAVDGRYFGSCMHLVHKLVPGTGTDLSFAFSVLGFFLEPTDSEGLPKFRDLLGEWEAVETGVAEVCTANVATPAPTPMVTTAATPEVTVANVTAQLGGGRRLMSKQGHRELPRSFNPYELVPSGASMYTYRGSLTTPPCSEVVFWNVVDTPISISVREFLRLTNLILDYVSPESCEFASEAAPSGFTGRPVQNINGREIKRVCPVDFEDKLAGATAAPAASPGEPAPTSSAFSTSVVAAAGLALVATLL